MHTLKLSRTTVALAAAAALSACGGGSSGSTSTPPLSTAGTLGVALTDAPACGFDAVNVTVDKIRVNQSATASDTDAGWTDITLSPAKKINLLDLTNGALAALGETPLAAGHYTQLRLVLDANTGNGMANSVVPTGGSEHSLYTPSAVQSGIKLGHEFDVAAGQRVDLVLDFDACKSVLTKGNGSYALKPVVKVIPTVVNGISGVIAADALAAHVTVAAEQNGKVISATTPNPTTGEFMLARLAPGNYDVVITADGRAADVVGAVPVASATSTTVLSTKSMPIVMVQSMVHDASGTVTLAPASATTAAYVAARQNVPSGAVTIRYSGADLVSGAWAITGLPVAPPLYAAYSATPPLSFAPAINGVPGTSTYTFEASADGYASETIAAVNLGSTDQAGLNFTLTP